MANINSYCFSSKELHSNSGTIYYLLRYFDPSLQRWLNRDPVGESGGRNLYEFIGNDPTHRTDSWGLCKNGFPFFLNGAEILRTYYAPTYQPNISGYFTCGWSAVLEKRVRCYTCEKGHLSWHFEIEETVGRIRNSPSESHAYAEGDPAEVCKNFWASTKPPENK
jgi:RHS repeat-associated protein